MKRNYLVFILLACSIYSFAQIRTLPINDVKDPAESLIYSLPKTKIIVEVKTKQIQETPGIYFPYAERYLGLKDVCQSEKTHYEIESINISTKAVPDGDNTYVILQGKAKDAPSIELTPEGFLKSINGNASMKDPCTCKGSCACKEPCACKMDKADKPCCTENIKTQESSITTLEMQQANSSAKMAELSATQMFNLREARINLLTAEQEHAPSDGRSYEIILSELNRMEKYYMELFTGKRVEKTQVSTFEYDPQKDGEDILFRFSQLKGVVDKTNLGGDPIFINIKKSAGTQSDFVKVSNGNEKKEVSVFYRLPGKAQVKVTDGKNILSDNEINVAQFGKVLALPATTNVSSAEFCPVTGAILKLEK